MIEESDLLAHAENFPIAKTDEEWNEWWESRESDTRVHDEKCPRFYCDPRESEGPYGVDCFCGLINEVMERETMKLTNLRGYVIMTTERYEELVNRPEIPF